MTKIDSFSGQYDFLSNFHPSIIEYEGLTYVSVEHAYQAAKVLDQDKRFALSIAVPSVTAARAKKIGRNLKPLREGWDGIKRGIMKELLMLKFSQPKFRDKLLATGDAELVEGNWWHDTFFGVCMGEWQGHLCKYGFHEPVGQNVLGQLLMEVRTLLAAMPPRSSQPQGSEPEVPSGS